MCACVHALPVPLKYWQTLSRTLFSLEPGVTISSSRTHKRPLGSPSAARTLEIHTHKILNSWAPTTWRHNCIFICISAEEAANQTRKHIFHLNGKISSVKKNKYETIQGNELILQVREVVPWFPGIDPSGGTCGGGWSIAETTSAGLFSGFSNSTGILSCRPNVTFMNPKRPAAG